MARPEYKDFVLKRDKHCQHPKEMGGCTETKRLTVDHHTPKCIAKELGWTQEQLNDPMNLQALCEKHHNEKDATTSHRLVQVRKQLKGMMVTNEERIKDVVPDASRTISTPLRTKKRRKGRLKAIRRAQKRQQR